MPLPSPKRSGRRRLAEAALVLLLGLGLGGCWMYSFTGGGLPRHIRTVAVLPFDNETAQGLLAPQLQQLLQREVQSRLGVRMAAEAAADAVVRGRIVDFAEAAPGVRPGGGGVDGVGRPDVTQREVQIAVAIEIYDVREDRILWQSSGLRGVGQYRPEQQITEGIERALRDVVSKVIDGAQSQW
jgi:hypothetical protein